MAVFGTNSAQPSPAMQSIPAGENAGLTRRPAIFSQFVQTVAPNPVPSKSQFYREGMTDYFFKSYLDGNLQYYENLKKNPGMLSWVGGVTMGLGALFTMFTKFRGAVHYAAALAALAIPVMHANKTFPKMAEAYKTVQDGNPTQGREQFRKAMSDTVYNVFHVFLKPMTFAFSLAFLLCLPRVLRPNQKLGWIDKTIVKPLLQKLRVKPTNPAMRLLDKIQAPLERVGKRIESRMAERAPTVTRALEKLS